MPRPSDHDKHSLADQSVRNTLRRRQLHVPEGRPPQGPRELADLIREYWLLVSAGRESLLKCVKARAAAAGHGYDFQEAEDVLQNALLKGAEKLTAQYLGEEVDFVFDPDGERSLVSWLTSIIGVGYGPKAGVLGTELQRQRRHNARMVNPSEEESEVSEGEELLSSASIGADPARSYLFKEAVLRIASELTALRAERRFGVGALILFRTGEGATSAGFWEEIDVLIHDAWAGEERHRRLQIASAHRLERTPRPTEGYVLELIQAVVGQNCAKTFLRWRDEFLRGLRGGLDDDLPQAA